MQIDTYFYYHKNVIHTNCLIVNDNCICWKTKQAQLIYIGKTKKNISKYL